MIFAWIEERRGEWPITLLCRALDVSRSGFYAWLSREVSQTETRHEKRTEQVTEIHARMKERYGSPRIHAELVAPGVPCCEAVL